MKQALGLLFVITFIFSPVLRAQDASSSQLSSGTGETNYGATKEKTAMDLFHFDSTYVFQSDITTRDNYGKQDAIQSLAEYSHRFLLSGNVYLRTGLAYSRFDFGRTFAPLPLHLQSYTALVAVEYMSGNDIGAFFQVQPGFFTENDIGISSFDIPITAGRAFVLQPDKLYLFAGVNAAFLRGQFSPVLPLFGIVYRPSKQWTVDLVPPEPRIIYAPNDSWDFYLSGQITGWSYRTDRKNSPFFPPKLNGAQVDYSEYRAGIGVSYNPCKQVSLDFVGGYVFERQFSFSRADKKYTADPAPYVRLGLKAEF
ncbi:MAG TPA: hypothetical protein VGC85_02565 [Chthoniobacterales bacterium]